MHCNIANVISVPYDTLMQDVSDILLIKVPDDLWHAGFEQCNTFLAQFANYYSCLIELWGVIQREYRNSRVDLGGGLGVELKNKQELLFETARAVKLKYDATSRIISVIKMDLDTSR